MNAAKGAAAGFVGVLSVGAIIGAAHAAYDYADAIVDLSDRTGASTKAIQEFRYAAQLSGSSVESADAAVEKFSKNLGGALSGNRAMADGLRALGVTSGDVDTALRQFSDGIAKLPTRAQQNAAAMQYMGKSAGDLTLLLSGGSSGFSELAAKAQELGIVMEDDVLRNAGQVNDKLDTLKMIVNADMASMFVNNANAIATMVEQLIKLAGAATQALNAMNIQGDVSMARSKGAPWYSRDLRTNVMGAINGTSADQEADAARQRAMSTHQGRVALFQSYKQDHDEAMDTAHRWERSGQFALRDRSLATARAAQAQGAAIWQADLGARNAPARTRPPATNAPTIQPHGGAGGHAAHHAGGGDPAAKEASRMEAFNRELFAAQRGELQARLQLASNIGDQARLKREMLDAEHAEDLRNLQLEIAEHKIKGDVNDASSEAGKLAGAINARYASELSDINNNESTELNQQKFEKAQLGLQFEDERNSALAEEARSSADHRKYLLASVEARYKIALAEQDAVINNQQASDYDREIARLKKKQIEDMHGHVVQQAQDQTMGPLEQYFDALPKTGR